MTSSPSSQRYRRERIPAGDDPAGQQDSPGCEPGGLPRTLSAPRRGRGGRRLADTSPPPPRDLESPLTTISCRSTRHHPGSHSGLPHLAPSETGIARQSLPVIIVSLRTNAAMRSVRSRASLYTDVFPGVSLATKRHKTHRSRGSGSSLHRHACRQPWSTPRLVSTPVPRPPLL